MKVNQEKEEKTNILNSIKRNSLNINQKTEQKNISELIIKIPNKPIKNNNNEEDKNEKENNEEIIKTQIPKNIPQVQFEKEISQKIKKLVIHQKI